MVVYTCRQRCFQLMEFRFTLLNACFNVHVAILIIDGNVPRYLLLKQVSLK